MKLVPLSEAKNRLSALIDEVEAGAEIVITRHGKPAARLGRPAPRHPFSDADRDAGYRFLKEHFERMQRDQPQSAEPLSWEQLKSEMDEDR
jgi:antitoxin (DNA-binding transcriptional repressor) of toxin-antitoxin stability system